MAAALGVGEVAAGVSLGGAVGVDVAVGKGVRLGVGVSVQAGGRTITGVGGNFGPGDVWLGVTVDEACTLKAPDR